LSWLRIAAVEPNEREAAGSEAVPGRRWQLQADTPAVL